MGLFRRLVAVPAYMATAPDGRCVPFIVSLLLYDQNKRPRIPPAVEQAIDRTMDITKRQGLITTIVSDDDHPKKIRQMVETAMGVEDSILLFRCQSTHTAEQSMRLLSKMFRLTLICNSV
jgi:hypothetical protein